MEEEQPQVQYIEEQPQAPPQPYMRSEKADFLDKIDPTKIVEIVRHRLMGERLDESGCWVIDNALVSRSLTAVGASDLCNLTLPAASQNVSITRLKDHEIKSRALSISETAQRMCLKNWKEYGITGTDQLYFVHEMIFTTVFVTLKQSEGGWIGNLIKGTMQEHRTVNDGARQESRRKFGFFRR